MKNLEVILWRWLTFITVVACWFLVYRMTIAMNKQIEEMKKEVQETSARADVLESPMKVTAEGLVVERKEDND